MRTFADVAKKMSNGSAITKVLTNSSDGPLVSDSSSGTYYLLPKDQDFKEVRLIAQSIFDESAQTETA
jgi:hypothetical protein